MADYSRPASGFRFKNGSLKTNAPPDAVGENKYPLLVNVRGTADTTLITRPGMEQLFINPLSLPFTDVRAYSALNTDNRPRFLARDSADNIVLDTSLIVGQLTGGGASPGATMIPFRPNQSPNPYMYIANGTDYKKFSAPDSGGDVSADKVGIIEPQAPPEAGISAMFQGFQGEPVGGGYTNTLPAHAVTVGNRITDQVVAVFPDPAVGQINTLQVTGGFGSAPVAVYLYGIVRAYFFPADHAWNGGFGYAFPLDTSSASKAAQGNSLDFNPTEFNGTQDPNVQPIEWAILDNTGAITDYQVPWSGATSQYDMVLIFQLSVPAAGNYTIKVNHDDGMLFAIAGASLISGPHVDLFGHNRTAVQGLTFTNTDLAGSNVSGFSTETFVVNFPSPGVYACEINYAQWVNEQSLNMRRGDGTVIAQGGAQSYQREMAILLDAQATIVQDVYSPLPQGLGVDAIYYFTGTTGRCVIVPASLSPGVGNAGISLYDEAVLAGLRRGALIQIGGETCLVESVSTGPNGTVCFETTTTGAHTHTELLNGVPAISVLGPASAGQVITSPDAQFTVATGIGKVTSPVSSNLFVSSNSSFQNEDYIHFSVNIDSLALLNEIKILFDVGDGSFTQNFYYFTVRPSDIAAGVQNTLTQLGVAQLVTQRAIIDAERAKAKGNQALTFSSAQTNPGDGQWSEIMFPISALTRVGNAQDKSLQNVNAVQWMFNVSDGPIAVLLNSLTVTGGYAPDVGDVGIPYQYRIRPRSSVTGVKGNPSPATRYGLSPRRQQVEVILPVTYVDPQMDVWDVFRFGGSLTSWRFIGFAPLAAGNFMDNFGDDAAESGEALDFDNLEPWPTIDLPLNATSVSVTGTTALVTVPSPTNILRLLPGNLIQLGGQNVYHLWTRPTLISGSTYLLQFQENAGALTSVSVVITEPLIARQFIPYMWGPDADGTVFAVGDGLRPGTISFAKNNNPDSAPDKYNLEITPPSEPLMGGETKNGVSYVASTERWWRLYAQGTAFLNPEVRTQHYSAVQQGIPRGLAAPLGHCTDGRTIYWWAKDGIWSDEQGSLTDADLYNLFPHEGVAGIAVTYNGVTAQPPDYARAGSFRLACSGGFLYATYPDANGVKRQLTLDIKAAAWRIDESPATRVGVVYHVEQQEGTVLSAGATYPRLLLGAGTVMAQQRDRINDLGAPITCTVATMEWDAGDIRASQNWGDALLDLLPAAAVSASPMSGGTIINAPTVFPPGPRVDGLVSLDGGTLTRFLGLFIHWTDDFAHQSVPTQLFAWQPSYINKPETIGDRDTDWMNVQEGAAGWVQGFVYHADTGNQVKGLQVRDSDTLALHSFTPTFQHNGESIKAYSFDTPFIAHQVRFEPTDQLEWRSFDVVIVAEPTPEVAETWQTQGTAFGLTGYMHVKQVSVAYAASAPVTLEITSYDGQSPVPILLPSTGGAFQKATFQLTANKGQLYFFKAGSALPFQMYLPDWEIMVGQWGRQDGYLRYRSLGGVKGDQARV